LRHCRMMRYRRTSGSDTHTRYRHKGGNVNSAGWQVTLCDPIWHVSSRSGEASCKLLYTLFTFKFYLTKFIAAVLLLFLPSVLWCCWLGGRKGIRPVKKQSGGVLVWFSVWGKVQTRIQPSRCHCHSLSLASVKSRLVFPFSYRLTRVVPEKGR